MADNKIKAVNPDIEQTISSPEELEALEERNKRRTGSSREIGERRVESIKKAIAKEGWEDQ